MAKYYFHICTFSPLDKVKSLKRGHFELVTSVFPMTIDPFSLCHIYSMLTLCLRIKYKRQNSCLDCSASAPFFLLCSLLPPLPPLRFSGVCESTHLCTHSKLEEVVGFLILPVSILVPYLRVLMEPRARLVASKPRDPLVSTHHRIYSVGL